MALLLGRTGAALSMMNDGQLSPASSAFSSPTHGAALSMMNNDINNLDKEIVWISVDEPGEIDFIHPGSMWVPCEIEEPEIPEIGGADNTPLEAHNKRNPQIERFKAQLNIPHIEIESAISSSLEIF